MMKVSLVIIFALAISGKLSKVEGHVALTYPPARKYDLDFLDTLRTEGPCGMNKGNVKTPIVAGWPLNVTWHLGYPHDGGFNLEILDKNGASIKNLTDGFDGASGKTVQHAQVDIPDDLTCSECTIRLTRQAIEWGKSYLFKSCADVEIVSRPNYINQCSKHGTPSGGSCSCEGTYFGDQCQYKNDCEVDADCSNRGRCLSHGGSSNPQKECYCNIGYFGRQCQHNSGLTNKKYNPSLFNPVNLTTDVQFLWRYLDAKKEVMEGVVIVKTLSYVAIGWRPDDLSNGCQKFPEDAPIPKVTEFHAMDCQDIVIGKVIGDRSNIGDYYTRDRSTPRRDEVYGGQDDLLGAVGWEENGVTTVWFRKKVESGLKADHAFYGRLKLIWAYGRSDDLFYKPDEIKYHGAGNRGQYTLQSAENTSLSRERQILLAAIILLLIIVSFQAAQNIYEKIQISKKFVFAT